MLNAVRTVVTAKAARMAAERRVSTTGRRRRSSSTRSSGLVPTFSVDELDYALADVVADSADFLHGFALGIRQRPVVALRARHDRALVTAAHRHQRVDALA